MYIRLMIPYWKGKSLNKTSCFEHFMLNFRHGSIQIIYFFQKIFKVPRLANAFSKKKSMTIEFFLDARYYGIHVFAASFRNLSP